MTAWRPSASIATLRFRARSLARIREYFAAANVLEVDTPKLATHAAPDPSLSSFIASPAVGNNAGPTAYLQTSPEFALKRLLAAGSGDVYQLGPAFRADETGRHHLCEFTLLEWYRLNVDHYQLMDDVERLLQSLMARPQIARESYSALFKRCFNIEPHDATVDQLAACARTRGFEMGAAAPERGALLDALYAEACRREVCERDALFIFDFPIEHAAYARLDAGPPYHARRFELVMNGIEIANGYHEVSDAAEQRRRFAIENARRRDLGLEELAIDTRLLAALEAGLPDCSGVALGVDRLLMVVAEFDQIRDVVAFEPMA